MLFLQFEIDNKCYAVRSQEVLEVLPLVVLEKLPHTPEYMIGIFNYRGQIVPVVDLCQFIWGRSCREHLSTRIILTRRSKEIENQTTKPTAFQIWGLMTEKVVETLHRSETELIDSDLSAGTAPYLSKVILNNQDMIHCIDLNNLFSQFETVPVLSATQNNSKGNDPISN